MEYKYKLIDLINWTCYNNIDTSQLKFIPKKSNYEMEFYFKLDTRIITKILNKFHTSNTTLEHHLKVSNPHENAILVLDQEQNEFLTNLKKV